MQTKQTMLKPAVNAEANAGQSPMDQRMPAKAQKINGPKRSEPTRYGDWERKGRYVDF